VLRAMAANIPALAAEDSLRHASEMAVASGRADNAREIIRSWERDAGGGSRTTTRAEVAAFAAAAGFTVAEAAES
jgi:hypothetical protein